MMFDDADEAERRLRQREVQATARHIEAIEARTGRELRGEERGRAIAEAIIAFWRQNGAAGAEFRAEGTREG